MLISYFLKYIFIFIVNVIKSEYMLVCWVCKLVMEGGPEELDEHMARDHEFDDALNRYILSSRVLL